MVKPLSTRRSFLEGALVSAAAGWAAAASSTAPAPSRLGANDRIHLGIIGMGDRGNQLVSWIQRLAVSENVTITAVCDLWNRRRETAVNQIRDWANRSVHDCRNMSELCARRDVDAVVIATADFQHASLARQAVEAGKDVYCEKPFGCDFEEIRAARQAIRKSDRVFQAGTQLRAHGIPWAARKLVQSEGLGKVSYVDVSQPLFHQRWWVPGAQKLLREQDTDWKEYLSYLPMTPFNPRHYVEFRLFWPYSTGIFCQWMSHVVDLVNLVLDEQPRRVNAAGGVYVWHDGRTNPDTVQCTVEYASGCLFNYHMRLANAAHTRPLTFYGTNGTLDLDGGVAYGDGGGGEVVLTNPGGTDPQLLVDASTRLPDRQRGALVLPSEPDIDHMSDFFACMRSRRQPRASVDTAFDHALASVMAGMSLRTGRRVVYDPEHDSVRTDA